MNFQHLVGKTIIKVDEYPKMGAVTIETSDGERIDIIGMGDNYGNGELAIAPVNSKHHP